MAIDLCGVVGDSTVCFHGERVLTPFVHLEGNIKTFFLLSVSALIADRVASSHAKFVKATLKVLQALLGRGLAAVDLVSGGASISSLVHDDSLVLLNLGLDLVELLHLLLHLSNGILVLLLQTDNGGFLLNLGLLEVASELGHLSLPLLVELHLSTGGAAGLTKTLTKVLQLTGEVRPLPLSLGSALSLGLEFLLHLLDPGLDLLDGLLDLGHEALLILELAQEARGVLLLALDGVLELLPGPLKLRHSLLENL